MLYSEENVKTFKCFYYLEGRKKLKELNIDQKKFLLKNDSKKVEDSLRRIGVHSSLNV